jgi:hypothetical protein
MRTWTNLTWPDDPYRTGQQLYRKPGGRLAAFTTWPAAVSGQPVPATTAIAYLPLHRTRPVTVTAQTLTFGFRAASASDPAEVPGVAAAADLDLMQARRHAAVLAGYHLGEDLTALQEAGGVTAFRGLAAVIIDWAGRSPAAGRAALFDCDLDLPGGLPLGQACQKAGIIPMATAGARGEGRNPVTLAVERALSIALLCARHQGRYEWAGTLDIRTVMTASAWDCLPWPETAAPGGADPVPAAAPGRRQ